MHRLRTVNIIKSKRVAMIINLVLSSADTARKRLHKSWLLFVFHWAPRELITATSWEYRVYVDRKSTRLECISVHTRQVQAGVLIYSLSSALNGKWCYRDKPIRHDLHFPCHRICIYITILNNKFAKATLSSLGGCLNPRLYCTL